MSERDRYARSFGSIAEAYEANRPPYASSAIDWIAEQLPLRDVCDLGAGTGKLTRQLLEHGARVIAVEPDPDMRRTFARVLPDVPLLDGRAEAIPLADASVDVVTVGQAFHWFDLDAALPELRRITRPGGGYALTWNIWSAEDPILAQLQQLLATRRTAGAGWDDSILPDRQERRFGEDRTMQVEQIEGWVASTSAFVMAPRDEQERLRAEVRRVVGGPVADVRIETHVIVAPRG